MVLLGILARVDCEARDQVEDELTRMGGVETFGVEDPLRMGILVTADDLDSAHAILTRRIDYLEGVLGTWPVYASYEDADFGETEASRKESGVS